MLSLFVVYLIEWQKELEFEEEGRKNHRTEPYVNFLAAVQSCRKGPKPIFDGFFSISKKARRLPTLTGLEPLTNPSFRRRKTLKERTS